MRSMNENERERTVLLNPIRRLNHGSIVSIVGIFASAALIFNGCSFRPANAIQQIYQVLCIGFGFLLLIASEIASNTRTRRKD